MVRIGNGCEGGGLKDGGRKVGALKIYTWLTKARRVKC